MAIAAAERRRPIRFQGHIRKDRDEPHAGPELRGDQEIIPADSRLDGDMFMGNMGQLFLSIDKLRGRNGESVFKGKTVRGYAEENGLEPGNSERMYLRPLLVCEAFMTPKLLYPEAFTRAS